MKTAVILGASGLVGSNLLQYLLESDYYQKVIAFVRKDLGIYHNKLKTHIIDFDKPETYQSLVVGDDIFCCLGTTIAKAGSQASFRKVDYDYPVYFAHIAKDNKFKQYLLVSSVGASTKSPVFYLKTKGEAEEAISKIEFESISIFRPASLVGNRKEFRLNEKVMLPILKICSFLLIGKFRKYRPIKATKVAQAMLKAAKKQTKGTHIIESDNI